MRVLDAIIKKIAHGLSRRLIRRTARLKCAIKGFLLKGALERNACKWMNTLIRINKTIRKVAWTHVHKQRAIRKRRVARKFAHAVHRQMIRFA